MDLINAMQTLGPCLSTDLAEFLVREHGVQPAAARQRVSRAPKDIKRLNLPFPRRSSFLYLAEDHHTSRFWKALAAAIDKLGGSYSMALAAVDARTIVPIAHFPIVCGAPIKQRKHLAADAILNRLQQSEAIAIQDVPGLGQCVVSRAYARHADARDRARATARLLAERVLLETTCGWIRRLALASWNKVALRDDPDLNGEQPRVGTFNWDMTGPSYLAPLSSWDQNKKRKPGYLTCDVLLNEEVTAAAIAPFLHKCQTLGQLRNVAKVLHIFVANGYSKDAFNAARQAGIVPATPSSLFGKDIAGAFRELSQVLMQTALGTVDPEKYQNVINKLDKVEGAAGNMRGALFELLVAEIIRHTEYRGGLVKLNKIFHDDAGEPAEVDVFLEHPITPLVIECKGRDPNTILPDEEVKVWLHKRIQRVREDLNRKHYGPPIKPRFELWITGRLSLEAIEMILKTRKANERVYTLDVIWSKQIREKAAKVHDNKFLETLNSCFLTPLENGEEDELLSKAFPDPTGYMHFVDEEPTEPRRRRRRHGLKR